MIQFKTSSRKILGDLLTPVQLYLRARDLYSDVILLESSDYRSKDSSYSYICFDAIAKFEVKDGYVIKKLPSSPAEALEIERKEIVLEELESFVKSFEYHQTSDDHITHGLFGYTSYNAVRYFEDIDIREFDNEERKIPDLLYQSYRYVVIFNHNNDEVIVYEHLIDGQESRIEHIATSLQNKTIAHYPFAPSDEEFSNFTDEDFLEILQKGKEHCFRGDVFQIVLSRRFSRDFRGDEFLLYRALRHINPSPYLFFFDYGGFKIFGSSPEAQIVLKNGKATIYPIAGTVRRTGNEEKDLVLTEILNNDPKENSEHVMLVDLARNDLSGWSMGVEVENFKEVQYYSHVIHLVSKVTGKIEDKSNNLQLVADTFPAGTLSGAPKYKAMELINQYEPECRGYYGGAIGYLGFNKEFNHAIMIRTVLSKGNTLFYQAGAGVVAQSKIENELEEVNNKLLAIKKAIEIASKL